MPLMARFRVNRLFLRLSEYENPNTSGGRCRSYHSAFFIGATTRIAAASTINALTGRSDSLLFVKRFMLKSVD